MAKIELLDPSVSNKIAAGEVVERPSSIVKELVENSIDAGSSSIAVEIAEGGLSLVKVTDNGVGMDAEDAENAFIRHATSKLKSAEDLSGIRTLGFRGEALAATASVSKISMWTRAKGTESGVKVTLEGGKLIKSEPFGAPVGTSISVTELFFNTPARKRFMKKPHIEAGYCQEAMMRQILARPDIAFRFLSDGKLIYNSPGTGNIRDAVAAVYGRGATSHLSDVSGELPGGGFSGVIGDMTLARVNRKRQCVNINGRAVVSFEIASAVEEAFDTLLMLHKFPFFVLDIRLPESNVDVNVHPAKLEVRISGEREIRSRITSAVVRAIPEESNPFLGFVSDEEKAARPRVTSEALFGRSQNASADQPSGMYAASSAKASETAATVADNDATREKDAGAAFHQASDENQTPQSESAIRSTYRVSPVIDDKTTSGVMPSLAEAGSRASGARPLEITLSREVPVQFSVLEKEEESIPFRIVGQVFMTYLIIETRGKMLVIDQHAAHERLLFDSYCEELNMRSVARQLLLTPEIITLDVSQIDILGENAELLHRMGFETEEFGHMSIRVTAVPMLFGDADISGLLQKTLELLKSRNAPKASDVKRIEIAKTACHAAIKANDPLDEREISSLLWLLAKHKGALTCPHGRPIFFEMTKYDIEKKFGRV